MQSSHATKNCQSGERLETLKDEQTDLSQKINKSYNRLNHHNSFNKFVIHLNVSSMDLSHIDPLAQNPAYNHVPPVTMRIPYW